MAVTDAEPEQQEALGVGAEGRAAAAIDRVLHESLFGDDITIRHRKRTGGTFIIDGIGNDVVTRYVEHAFLCWLVWHLHGVNAAKLDTSGNCSDPATDPDLFFPPDIDVKDFLALPREDDQSNHEATDDAGVAQAATHPAAAGDTDGASDAQPSAAYFEALARRNVMVSEAKKVCGGCTQSLECLTASIIHVEASGVWGGLSESERHLMINRFESMRRSYNNGSMPKGMLHDFESHARQIAEGILGYALEPDIQATAEPDTQTAA